MVLDLALSRHLPCSIACTLICLDRRASDANSFTWLAGDSSSLKQSIHAELVLAGCVGNVPDIPENACCSFSWCRPQEYSTVAHSAVPCGTHTCMSSPLT